MIKECIKFISTNPHLHIEKASKVVVSKENWARSNVLI